MPFTGWTLICDGECEAEGIGSCPAIPRSLGLGADTLVWIDDQILVNPRTWRKRRACLEIFRAYSFGGYGALSSLLSENYEETRWIPVRLLSSHWMISHQAYFSLVNPLDKAGGYAIQTRPDLIIDNLRAPNPALWPASGIVGFLVG